MPRSKTSAAAAASLPATKTARRVRSDPFSVDDVAEDRLRKQKSARRPGSNRPASIILAILAGLVQHEGESRL